MEFLKIVQDARLLFTAAGVLLVVASALGGGLEIKEIKIPKLRKGTRILSAVVGACFIGLGLLQAPVDTKIPIEVTIDSPRDQVVTPEITQSGLLRIVLTGTLNPTSPTDNLWIVIQDASLDYYPQGRFTPAPRAEWTTSIALGYKWYSQNPTVYIIMTKMDLTKRIGERIDWPQDAQTIATTQFKIVDAPDSACTEN